MNRGEDDLDVAANTGFVSIVITSDTAEFAVQSIRTSLARMGRSRYPKAKELTITADCGATTTKAGLKVECALDERTYEKGIRISDADMATLAIADDDFHPE